MSAKRRAINASQKKKRRLTASVNVRDLEVARGSDGFLRGAPEPVLLAAFYSCIAGRILLEGRAICRFARPAEIPATVARQEGEPLPRARRSLDPTDRFMLLLVAMEEDNRADITTLFAAFEAPDAMSAYLPGATDPTPYSLRELAMARPPNLPDAISCSLLIEEHVFATRVTNDDFVGAAFVTFGVGDAAYRARFVSDDGLNDWTANVDIRVA